MEFTKFDIKKHNFDKIIELIIGTEPDFFYLLFGKKKSISRVRNIIKAGKNSLGHDFIYLALERNKILGIITFYKKEEIDKRVESKKFSEALDFFGLLRLIYFEKSLLNKILTTKLDENDLYIGNICISKNNRGKGIGNFLLRNVIEEAKKKNCKRIILDVLKTNVPAINLYKKMGFKIIRERSSYLWKISIFQMIKNL